MAASGLLGDKILRKPTEVPKFENNSLTPFLTRPKLFGQRNPLGTIHATDAKERVCPIRRSSSLPDLGSANASLASLIKFYLKDYAAAADEANDTMHPLKESLKESMKLEIDLLERNYEDSTSNLGLNKTPLGCEEEEFDLQPLKESLKESMKLEIDLLVRNYVDSTSNLVLSKTPLGFEEEEFDLKQETMSFGQRIPPNSPPCPFGKEIPVYTPSKSPPLFEEAFGIMMWWPPTVAKFVDEKHVGENPKHVVPKFVVHFFEPLKQDCMYKDPPPEEEMKLFLERHEIYERMQLLWPSLGKKEEVFWSEVYCEHGSKSEFTPAAYFKAGLDAASNLASGGYLSRLDHGLHTVEKVLGAFSGFVCEINVVKLDEVYLISHIRIPLDLHLKVFPGDGRIVQMLPPAGTQICLPG